MKLQALVIALGIGLIAHSAKAATTIQGLAGAGYSTVSTEDDNIHSLYGGGEALVSFDDPGFGLQFGGAGGHVDDDDGSANQWNGDGHIFWRDGKGAIGLSSSYGSLNALSLDATAFQYGIFGDWFVRRDLSLRFRGGGIGLKVSGDYATGWYGGVGTAYYVYSDLSLAIESNYLKIGDIKITTGNLDAEYLVSREYPVSVAVGYNYTTADFYDNGINSHGWTIHLKYRFGASGSLVDLDRTGVLPWTGLAL
jgi:hypothetical protein